MSDARQANYESAPAMDPRIRDVQPGGGIVIRLEKAWGVWRRWWLKRFRSGYVKRMQACRQGDPEEVPHEVLDSRDLKLYRNQTHCHWRPEDDPFAWRDRLPFVRAGLAELVVISLLAWSAAFVSAGIAWFLVSGVAVRVLFGMFTAGCVVIAVGVAWFFRNPSRTIPVEPGQVVAPADGKVVGIERLDDPFVGWPAWQITIFLSVFNVHVNRAPVASRVLGIAYQPGKFLNALRPESGRENEQLTVRLEQSEAPFRRLVVRQITGAIARRIVCWLKPGDNLQRGEMFGMIKFGSRTVLVIPDDSRLEVVVQIGDKVKAGSSIVARYASES